METKVSLKYFVNGCYHFPLHDNCNCKAFILIKTFIRNTQTKIKLTCRFSENRQKSLEDLFYLGSGIEE